MAMESHLLEQVFVKEETAFNDSTYTTLAAADALLHRGAKVAGKNNRVPSPEKQGTPGRRSSLPRRKTAEWSVNGAWQPSGTLGTGSDFDVLLKALMGSKVISGAGVTTTVSASPTPTATGFTVASAAGLSVGDVIVVTLSSGREITRIKSINVAALTVDALSAAPATGAAVVAGVTYKLTTAMPPSLAVAKFYTAGGAKECVGGALVDAAEFAFSGEEEVTASFSGPAARYRRTGFTAPGSQTLVGAPVSGLVGHFALDGNLFPITEAKLSLKNNLGMRNKELGTAYASQAYRDQYREISVSVTFYMDDARLLDMAEASTATVVRLLTGDANGAMVGAVLPKVEFEIPEVGSNETGPILVTASGVAYESSGNDAIFLAEI